ncbi:unnamed protein product [Urochloa decumbens]|uniref:Uncharacterized protein n=1 Tax=Urochloa decumbens TaxID=240449 RepID=A0ABC9AAB7_9POAL
MAPPCGDAAAAAGELTSLRIRDRAGLPPLPRRGGGGVNAAEREEEGDKSKKARKEKAGAQRIAGWGLREYSKIVSKKVETKGRTTYNEVADEICAELKLTLNGQEFDEKNIRRRVYDAFNVLIALRVIAKDKKEIKWMGLSNFRYEKIKKLEEAHKELTTRIKNKKKLVQEIEKQFDDLQNIKFRNQVLQRPAESVNGICLPFLLVKLKYTYNNIIIEAFQSLGSWGRLELKLNWNRLYIVKYNTDKNTQGIQKSKGGN